MLTFAETDPTANPGFMHTASCPFERVFAAAKTLAARNLHKR